LEDVLIRSGAERDRNDKAKWHTSQGVLSVTGTKFMNWSRAVGGGGAIDLAMHLHNLDFKAAVAWLAGHFQPLFATGPPPPPLKRHLELPEPDTRMLSCVRRYLVSERCLPPSLIQTLVESRRLYADGRGNAVFLLLGEGDRAVGAELRGTGGPWRGMAPGSSKDLGYFSVPSAQAATIVLCESAIDALSCFVLYPERLCISTAGARPSPRWLPPLIRRAHQVYCGFDSDRTGDDMAQAMITLYPSVKRLRPNQHDWNDVLRAAR